MIVNFKKTILDKFDQHYFEINLTKCNHYSLFQEHKEIGSFYYSSEDSFGEINETPIYIAPTSKNFNYTGYSIMDLTTKQILGKFIISNWNLGKTLKANFDIMNETDLTWEVLKIDCSANLFTSKTISKFTGRLFSSTSYLTFKWDYQNLNSVDFRFEHLPVSGEVHFADNQNMQMIIVGLFMCEKELEKRISD